MKETVDSFPPIHTGSFLTKEQAEQFREAFKNVTSVVRCCDCIYFEQDNIPAKGCGYCDLIERTFREEDYCSYGQLKQEGR